MFCPHDAECVGDGGCKKGTYPVESLCARFFYLVHRPCGLSLRCICTKTDGLAHSAWCSRTLCGAHYKTDGFTHNVWCTLQNRRAHAQCVVPFVGRRRLMIFGNWALCIAVFGIATSFLENASVGVSVLCLSLVMLTFSIGAVSAILCHDVANIPGSIQRCPDLLVV